MTEPEPRRRFIDQPYILQIVALEQTQDLLRTLARDEVLPTRMRTACAKQHRKLAAFVRELRRRAAADRRGTGARGGAALTPALAPALGPRQPRP